MAEGTLKITKKYIIHEGSPEEQHYDSITQCVIRHGIPPVYVYIVSRSGKYGILDSTEKLITPMVYDAIYHDLSSPLFPLGAMDYFRAKKGGMSGIITSDNQVVFPFVYGWIDIDQIAISRIKMVPFFNEKVKKYGLLKWPSGEIVHEAQWDIIKITYSMQSYFRCGQKDQNDSGKVSYYWNIVDNEGRQLFYSCRYIHLFGYGSYAYNVAATKIENYYHVIGYTDYNIDIFYQDGTVVYSGKCHMVQRIGYYDNVFVIENPGGYGHSDNYSLHIYYQDEEGNHRLYHQEFECNYARGGYVHARYLILANQELQKLILGYEK